jgi:hypothetical protein
MQLALKTDQIRITIFYIENLENISYKKMHGELAFCMERT